MRVWTESIDRLWHSVLNVRRRRAFIHKPRRPLSHHGRAAIRLLCRFFSNPPRWLPAQLLLWSGLGLSVIVVYLGRHWLHGEAWTWLSSAESNPARTIGDIVLVLATPITIMFAVWRSRIAAATFTVSGTRISSRGQALHGLEPRASP